MKAPLKVGTMGYFSTFSPRGMTLKPKEDRQTVSCLYCISAESRENNRLELTEETLCRLKGMTMTVLICLVLPLSAFQLSNRLPFWV